MGAKGPASCWLLSHVSPILSDSAGTILSSVVRNIVGSP